MDEEWKDIEGFENLYQINKNGDVKSLPKKAGKSLRKEKILKKHINVYGYETVKLYKNKCQKIFQVHRLVAQAFIPNPNNFPQINHKDENKLNNNINNLEWCTPQYNVLYSLKNKICQCDLDGNIIKIWNSALEAERNIKVSNSDIIQCCKNKRKTAGGFIWKYR